MHVRVALYPLTTDIQMREVLGNTLLYHQKELDWELVRQDYSDGTCFYSTYTDVTKYGRRDNLSPVDYCSGDIDKLHKAILRSIEIGKKYIPTKNEKMKAIHEEVIQREQEFADFIKTLLK